MSRRYNNRRKSGLIPSRKLSGIAGGMLLVIGILWGGWLLLEPHTGVSAIPFWPGVLSTPVNVQATPLLAEGISLSVDNQTPTISQQQAILLANQLEPDAASQAKNVSANFVFLNYPVVATPATHANFSNAPVWLIWYQHIPLALNDPSTTTRSSHDLYVFLDSVSGKEVLKIWI